MIGPLSAVSTAPNPTEVLGPTLTSPQITAVGAIRAVGSMAGRLPECSIRSTRAWDVLIACQVQLRLAPTGHVVGIDMAAALRIAAARGFDLAVLSELLAAAETGLIEALSAGAWDLRFPNEAK